MDHSFKRPRRGGGGGFRGGGGGGRHHQQGDPERADNSAGGSRGNRFGGRRGGGGGTPRRGWGEGEAGAAGSPSKGGHKHPPHLKGKAIGLFYASRSQKNKVKRGELGTIELSEQKRRYIEDFLKSCKWGREPTTLDKNNYSHVEDSTFKRDFLKIINQSIEEKLQTARSKITNDLRLNVTLFEDEYVKKQDAKYQQMLSFRKKLPSFTMKDEILKVINENQICVLSGETGCGKTTQVPQFILDEYILERKEGSKCRILVTQPRRISAISVAERVAEERAEALGRSVGFHIRLENKLPRDRGSITYCTTGIVHKIMESDPALSEVSHLILDEIHERNTDSDFILALIKQIIPKRPDLKIVLMSATLNAEKFSQYYDNAPHINIPGFTFPVQEFFLEDVIERTGFQFDEEEMKKMQNKGRRKGKQMREKDEAYYQFNAGIQPYIRQLEAEKKYSANTLRQLRNPASEITNLDLIVELLIHICEDDKENGAILIFLPGYADISSLIKLVQQSGRFPASRYLTFPLHSQMPTIEQKQIFQAAPRGMRKIIVATNIAETSITIDDVVFVIDCGKIKVNNFDPETNTQTLAPQWVSLANASQRKGRAGRVKSGVCFHLYTKYREMQLDQFILPEILRTRLEDTILTAKLLQLGKIEKFFEQLIDCPEPESVSLSLNLLKQMNALDDDENLTPLGYHLAKLPMAPQMGKMILFGAIFSCLDPILSIAATLDFKDAYQLVIGQEQEADRQRKELADGMKSDHLLYHKILQTFQECGRNTRQFCWQYFLSSNTLSMLVDMKRQFMQYLLEMNFVNDLDSKAYDLNRNSDNQSLVKAIVCAGLYPNLLISHKLGKTPSITLDGQKAALHPKSVLNGKIYFDSKILVYYKKVKSTSNYVHDATMVHPLPVIFFGDHFASGYYTAEEGVNNGQEECKYLIKVSQSLKFKSTERTAQIIGELRNKFNWFLEYKISHPGPVLWRDGSSQAVQLLEVIMDLITCEDLGIYDDDYEDGDDDSQDN